MPNPADPNGLCVVAPECTDDIVHGCAAEGRACYAGGCDACLTGYLPDGDACALLSCGGEGVPGGIGDTCDALARTCTTVPQAGPLGTFERAECGACLPGHLPDDVGDGCRPVETCATLGCAEVRRRCVPGGADLDAECGACVADHEAVGGRCAPRQGAFCDGEGDLTEPCAAEGRLCDPAGPLGARCGACVPGRVEHPATGECVEPMDCASLGCEAQGRRCEPDPTAQCAGCLETLVADEAGFCRPPHTCGDLTCGRLDCAEAAIGLVADAQCVTPCRDDQLWNSRECAPCPPCDGPGEVGRAPRTTLAGWCICETAPGYFYSTANEVGAVLCDADGDGWVRESARLVFDSGDPVLLENARCTLRRIDRVVLHTEADAEVTGDLDAPLPLYESVRNDDERTLRAHWARAALPTAPWGPDALGVNAALINPFTKLCHGPRADYNDNGHADVYEHAATPLAPGVRPDQQPFSTYSYFAELHRGWFAPLGDDPAQGAWHIAERPRDPADPAGVPVRDTGDAQWWQQCVRRADPTLGQDPPVGLDFAADGLTHHSQFKCVVVRDVPDESQPLEMTPRQATDRYTLNHCAANDAPLPAAEPNPAAPRTTCAPLEGEPAPGTALWAAVPYALYAANPDHVGYAGGCVNTCAEAMFRHAADANDLLCPGLPVNIPDCVGLEAEHGRLLCNEVPCDLIDNDGDGAIDEEPPLTCPTGLLGVCATGAPRCEGTALICDAPAPTNEVCDGLDNDCDGEADEDTGGVPCAAESPSTGLPGRPGLPGVCGDRSTICINGQLDCLPVAVFEPGDEATCDGLDNDCDGEIDEALPGVQVPGQPEGILFGGDCQPEGVGPEGACARTTWQCLGGEPTCVSVEQPKPEGCPPNSPATCRRICDGVDNDCDGETDEDGACLRNWRGRMSLNPLLRRHDANMGGSKVTMNVAVEFGGQGTEEVTATLTIEALEQYHTPTEGFIERTRGAAAEGMVASFIGGNRFSLTYIDVDETRDTLKVAGINPASNAGEPTVQSVSDHNAVTTLSCHGKVSGAVDMVEVEGTYRSDRIGCVVDFDLDYTIVPPENPCLGDPVPEICDGIDNDCDGTVDEVERPVPDWVEVRFGPQTRFDPNDQIVAIMPDGTEHVVLQDALLLWIPFGPHWLHIGVVSVHAPGHTLQLRFDDLGDVDWEGFEFGRPDQLQIELLRDHLGNVLPKPAALDILLAGQPSEPVVFANGLGLGQTCGNQLGACRPGTWVCQDGVVDCAGGQEAVAEPNVCDTIDNDCDGETDEDIRQSCDSTCGRGTQTCDAGAPCLAECPERCGVLGLRTCAPGAQVYGPCEYTFPDEICDRVDNNCDGDIDEGFEVDEPCEVGQGLCFAEGVWGCTANGARACSALPGAADAELCNGLDDDCDGDVDNLQPPLADVQAGVCAGARQICDGANGLLEPDYSAQPDYEAPEVTCDGLDNDCDGAVDNLDAPLAANQVGICAGAEQICDGANGFIEPDYGARADAEQPEATCDDGLDNDCDGLVDQADGDCP